MPEPDALKAFIAHHATSYDPATDTYRRPPFAAPVKAGKNTPIYNAHSYHTKVPPQGIVPYILHYTGPGDLIPQWQMTTLDAPIAKPLDQILEENFWPDERTGRWRLPTKAERRRMSAKEEVSAQAHLRVVHRYLDGHLERRPSDLELCAWIRFCYRREFYAEAVAIFPHVDETRVDAEEYRKVSKIVEVCRLKSEYVNH